jgi:nucleotide-binding universal stress UspA family protein
MNSQARMNEASCPSILAVSPLDGDDWSAIDRAALLARRWKCRLIVLKAKDNRELSDAERRSIKEGIERRIAMLGPPGPVELISGAAYSSDAILEAVKQFTPRLVVMAPSVVWALGSLMDTAPEAVAAGTRCPVLVTGSGSGDYACGLMATDLSQSCVEAVGQILRLELLSVDRLTVLHAFSPLNEAMVTYAGVDPKEAERIAVAAEAKAMDDLDVFIDRCGLSGKVNARTSKAPPAAAVLEEAEAIQADLILSGLQPTRRTGEVPDGQHRG